MTNLERIDEIDFEDLMGALPPNVPFADPTPSPAYTTYSTSTTSNTISTGLTSPPPDSPPHGFHSLTSKSPRSVLRDLTWKELWAAWPFLEPNQIEGAKASHHPLNVMPWAENKDLYGNVVSFDAPLAIHPPHRTSYALMSPWTIGKLNVDRGMHLEMVRSIYELRFGTDYAPKFRAIWNMLQSWNPPWKIRRERLNDAVARANSYIDRKDYLSALGEFANAWMYTLPWFPEAGHSEDQRCQVASNIVGGIFSLIARTSAVACGDHHATENEHITRIGWTAAKAVLWRADQYTVNQVKMACNAGVMLSECLTPSPPRKEIAILWLEQAGYLGAFPNKVRFYDVPDNCRSAFFRFNARNEHFHYW